jgi:hypothetical protein
MHSMHFVFLILFFLHENIGTLYESRSYIICCWLGFLLVIATINPKWREYRVQVVWYTQKKITKSGVFVANFVSF